MEHNISKGKLYASVFALGTAGASIFIIPYIKFVFYDLQLQVTGMNNTQSALLLTIFAITSIVIGVPGGMIVDKKDPKKTLIVALLATTVITVLYAFTCTSYAISVIIWIILSFLTMGIYWPAFGKILNVIGAKTDKSGEGKSGMSFGFYYMCNGIFAAIIEAVALWASTLFDDPGASFRVAVYIAAAGTLLSAVIVYFLIDRELITADDQLAAELAHDKEAGKLQLSQITEVLKNPMVWMMLVVCLVGYTMYTTQSYFTPFLTAVAGVSASTSGIFAIIRTYVFFALAPIGGILADKVFKSTSRWFTVAFIILALVVFGMFLIPSGANPMMVGFYTLIPAALVQMTYTIKYSVISEIGISTSIMGTAVGLASVAGSIADVVFSPLIGYLLDTKGNAGYYYMFGGLVVILAIGCVCALVIVRHHKKMLVQEVK